MCVNNAELRNKCNLLFIRAPLVLIGEQSFRHRFNTFEGYCFILFRVFITAFYIELSIESYTKRNVPRTTYISLYSFLEISLINVSLCHKHLEHEKRELGKTVTEFVSFAFSNKVQKIGINRLAFEVLTRVTDRSF